MKRVLAGAAIAACAVFVFAGSALHAAAQQPVFRGTGDVVRVFVTATDRDGRLDTSLVKDDFEVRDDGKPQSITLFDKTPQPIRLIVLLDVSGSMEGNLPLLRGASEQLFARLRPDDVARVGAFGDEVTISPEFTHDASVLLAALPQSIRPNAPTPLWRAISQGIDTFEKNSDQRAVILVLSDGKDEAPIDFRHRPVSQGEVIERARDAGVMIYAVGMRSRPSRPPMMGGYGAAGLQASLIADLPDPGLARVAEETGGGYTEIKFGQDLGAAFAAVADELHGQYLLGYAPPKRDGKKHDISVRIAKKGVKPRARKSYVAPKQEG